MKPADTAVSAEVKQCCANLYESDFAKLLLGDSFHPGGLKLTGRLGHLLHLDRNSRVLDVASGRGTSAMFLAERFGCKVVGLDFGQQNVQRANSEAAERGLSALVQFEQGDSESLPFPDGSFDAVICECALHVSGQVEGCEWIYPSAENERTGRYQRPDACGRTA